MNNAVHAIVRVIPLEGSNETGSQFFVRARKVGPQRPELLVAVGANEKITVMVDKAYAHLFQPSTLPEDIAVDVRKVDQDMKLKPRAERDTSCP